MSAILLLAILLLACTSTPASAGRRAVVEIEGHRGESHDAPENTMASFKLAWQRGDDAAELDVHLTKDGKLIVCHDPDTERVTGTKRIIKQTTADELRPLDAGKWKGPQFTGEKLPMLDEVLATVPAGKRLFIEVKAGPEAVPELARCLERVGKAPEQTVIIGFNINTVREAKRQLPRLRVYWLADLKQDKETKAWGPPVAELIAKAKGAGVDGIDVSAKEPVDAGFVKAVHDAGLECYVWTVDDPQRARELAKAGVDGITTNRAAWLREQLKQEWEGASKTPARGRAIRPHRGQ